jgi:UMP-CMP kinase
MQRLLRSRAAAACALGASLFHTRSALLAPDDAAYAYVPPLRLSAVRSAEARAAALPRVRVPRALPRVLFVLGGPGSGKGTQCALLASQFGFEHLSAGELLREERARGGPTAEMIEEVIRAGRIVPTEVTVGLLKAAIARSPRGKFLVDGFPRNFENLQGWVAQMEGAAEVDGLLMFDVPEEVMVARLLERGKTSGRSDDNETSIRLRLRTYADSTVPGSSLPLPPPTPSPTQPPACTDPAPPPPLPFLHAPRAHECSNQTL